MVRFLDGPAAGITLNLRRAPLFLRVVCAGTTWDALDQLTDQPRPKEMVYVYLRCTEPRGVHIRSSKRGASGYYQMCDYRFVEPQPVVDVTDTETWQNWCLFRQAAMRKEHHSAEQP